MDDIIKQYDRAQAEIDKIDGHVDMLLQRKWQHDTQLLIEQSREEARRDALRLHEEDLKQRALDRAASREDRLMYWGQLNDLRERHLQAELSKPGSASYWDSVDGRIAQPSNADLIANAEAVKKGQPSRYGQKLAPQAAQETHLLATAGPALDALDNIIDDITKEAPGENITAALLQRLKRRAGIGEKIALFQSLNMDAAIEQARALSGTVPRIAILRMIKGEAQPNEMQTTSVAHTVNDALRTSITNKVSQTTGDPQAFKKMQSENIQYKIFEMASTPPETMWVRLKGNKATDQFGPKRELTPDEKAAGWEIIPAPVRSRPVVEK